MPTRILRFAPSIVAALALGAAAARASGDFGRPLTSVYTAADIGANAMGWSIVQDGQDVMHFGCNALVSFDGDRWRASVMGNSYALRGLDVGPDGRIWAASVGELGWFERGGSSGWIFHSLLRALPEGQPKPIEMWNAFADRKGAIFVAQDRVYCWDGQAIAVHVLAGERRLSAFRADGEVYVHHLPTGLYRVRGQDLELVIPANTLGNAAVLAMERREGGWLMVTSRGLFLYAQDRLEPVGPEASAFVRQNGLSAVAHLDQRRLALGTLRGGIGVISPEGSLIRRLSTADGLPTNEIFSLGYDREGGLWGTSNSLIFRVSMNAAVSYGEIVPGNPDQSCVALSRVSGKAVAVMDDGIYGLEAPAGSPQRLAELRGHVWNAQSSDQGLLIGTNTGVYQYSGGVVTALWSKAKDVFDVLPSRRPGGGILLSASQEVLRFDRGSIQPMVTDLPDSATSMAEDSLGRIWMGTASAGFLEASLPEGPPSPSASVRSFGLPDGPIGPTVAIGAGNGVVLALSTGAGWVLRAGASRFDRIADYPERKIAASAARADGSRVWLLHPPENGSPATLAYVEFDSGGAKWVPVEVEGLWKVGMPTSLLAEKDGSTWSFWVGGSAGVLRTVWDPHAAKAPPPSPVMRLLSHGQTSQSTLEALRPIPYEARTVTVELGLPSYSRRPSLRVQTRISGVDADWVWAGNSLERDLTALREGNYEVEARSVSSAGETSPVVAARFAVLPPWWRTWPVEGGAILLLTGLGYLLYAFRARALRRRTRELEALVKKRTEQVEKANAAKTEFMANISHDIRNPLNGIVGLALALEGTPLDTRQREFLSAMNGCAGFLTTLVDDVLDFAKIESGKIELRPTPFSPRALWEGVAAMLGGEAAARGARFEIRVDADLPPRIIADTGRLQQVLMNYADNALKYAGGRIELIAERQQGASEMVQFSVTDHGPGFSDLERAMLFTRFGRLRRPSESVEGTGLGLSVCRRIADLMGGSVGADSEPGRGASFYIRLPLVEGQGTAEGSQAAFEAASVLVVEDADYNAWATAAVLSRMGLAVEARARTGAEALERAIERHFDIILLDCNLPDVSGIEVAGKLRALQKDGKRSLVIAVTAYATAEDRTACLAAGMDGFVGKPLTPAKLRAVLKEAGVPQESEGLWPNKPDFNASLLGYLSDGSSEGLRRERGRYLEILASESARLAEALRGETLREIEAAAHRLLAHAQFVDAEELRDAAALLERATRFGPAELVPEAGRKALAAAEALREALSAEASAG